MLSRTFEGAEACQVPQGAPAAAGPAAPAVDPAVVAQSATMRLPIPMPVAKIGPDPNLNEWKMAAVGYPLWLWVEGPDPYEHRMTVTEQGITLNLVARRQTTQFDLGDGEVKYCGATPMWTRSVTPGEPSKRCGYVYEQPSLPKGTYAVTATTIWVVEWSALGQSGTLPFERTGPATQLPVGELHAVRVR